MDKLQSFYKSKRWEAFTKVLKLERAQSDGTVVCEHCGKPIVKAYDCIAHHKQELTPDNVDNANISLNPENIMLVHFKCHNEIHKRFGFGSFISGITQNVYIVYGAPCAGKTTFVREVADVDDLILDIDRLYNAIRAEKCGPFDKPQAIKNNVFALRDCLLDMIRVRRGRWLNAYIIGGYPLQGERERLADSVRANKIIFVDTPKDVCIQRAKLKSPEWVEYVEQWFERYIPPVDD